MQEKLLMIPGPSPVHPRIIHALSLPTISHVAPEIVDEMKEALANLKKVVFCERGEAFIISGSGTLAMEMALLNTVKAGERILVLSQGFFGERMLKIARCFGIEVEILESRWGRAVLPKEVKDRVSRGKYAAVVSTHVDTATGACAPVRQYAELFRDETIFILDGVCATGGIEEKMDEWGVDVILSAAQKCFGAPPGLALLVLSERAMEKRKSMGPIPAYYGDLLNWLPVMKDPSKYFSTPCVNEIRAFTEATRIVLEEGLEKRFHRHSQTAQAIRTALSALGLSLFTEEPFLADTLSVVKYPEGIEDELFRREFAARGVIVAGGLGETKGTVFRMGHMGNISQSQVYFALEALEATLSSLEYEFHKGAALEAAKSILESKAKN